MGLTVLQTRPAGFQKTRHLKLQDGCHFVNFVIWDLFNSVKGAVSDSDVGDNQMFLSLHKHLDDFELR